MSTNFSDASETSAMQMASTVTTSVDHPRLVRADAESIRIFLRLYDQYCNEVLERARQIGKSSRSTENVRPVNIKFCVDPDYLESLIALNLIPDVKDYDSLTDDTLRAFLDEKAEESREATNLDSLDIIVEQQLRMDMKDRNAKSRMENLFVAYHTILRRNGLAWVVNENGKLAVTHVLSAILPRSLKTRLQSDLEFAYVLLKKDFSGFMAHAIKLSEAYQLLDNGASSHNNDHADKSGKQHRTKSRGGTSRSLATSEDNKDSRRSSATQRDRSVKQPPLCLHPPCRAKGIRHWMGDCGATTEAEKLKLRAKYAEDRAKDGPAHNTRGQGNFKKQAGTAGRLRQKQGGAKPDSPSCEVTIAESDKTLAATGRCDDGSDDSIVSPELAERAVLAGIGTLKAIPTVRLQVALKAEAEAQVFSFSRRWTCPRTILHLAAGQLALCNISFLVAEDDLACEDMLIGLPVLQHLKVDTKTLLENNRATLDGVDCSKVGQSEKGSTSDHADRLVTRMEALSRNEASEVDQHRERVNYYQTRQSEDPFPDPSLLDPIDSEQHAHINQSIESMLKKAEDNGMPRTPFESLKKTIHANIDLFRTTFSAGKCAQVPPLKIDLRAEAQPIRVRLRKYSQPQQEFLTKLMKQLMDADIIYPNPTASWASAPLLVEKPGPAKFRFTVDLRPVNQFTVKHQYPMPNLEHELTKLSSSAFFATFDLSHGYWQFPLAEESQECQSFITPDGIYTPRRVLHGTTNAVTYLQSSLATIIPESLRANVMFWLDDILLHSATVEGLVAAIQELIGIFAQHNIHLHPDKCLLYEEEMRWCGRHITRKGIRFDPRRSAALREMEEPKTGADLQQFVCALQWMKSAIPEFATIVAPLHAFMETVYEKAGRRTKQAVMNVKLEALGWTEADARVFHHCKDALEKQVTLSHRDMKKRLCVYTDASDGFWSGMLTQVPHEDLSKKHQLQKHEPLAFLSGQFNKTQMGWSVLEKEAYAVMATLDRMHWLVANPDGFDLFTDHNNLIFLFDPLAVRADLSQNTLRKVLRWAVHLSYYNYTCIHIKGVDNVWADLLGRWSQPATVRRLITIPPLPSSSSDDFEWPTEGEIIHTQNQAANSRPADLINQEGLWNNHEGAVWIPNDAVDLQMRLCVIAHTGPSGHRGVKATVKLLSKMFFWQTLSVDVRDFVKACIHCLSTKSGSKTPRPFGAAMHGTKPNDVLQFDYIELLPSKNGCKYVLMLRDDLSDYKWFFEFADTLATNAATAIIDWCAAFGVPKSLLSDGPTHFKNETVRLVCEGLRVPHHFTLPYCPWSNGAVERLGKELLRVFRAVLSELQMRHDEWPDLLPLVQSALNTAPSPQRGDVSPITAFTGLPPTPPISTFIRTATAKALTITEAQRECVFNIKDLQERAAELHPIISHTLKENRRRHRQASEKGQLCNFAEGDFVLVAREDFTTGEKLCLRWRGPRRVTKALNDFVYEVEDMRNGKLQEVHGSRMKFYSDSSLDTVAIMSHVLSSETGMQVARLMRLVESPNGIQVQVRWSGLSPEEDTLEDIGRVYEDVPKMLLRLLDRKNTPKDLATAARRTLDL